MEIIWQKIVSFYETLILCVFFCVCIHLCRHMWRPEVEFRYPPLLLFTLFCETACLTEPGFIVLARIAGQWIPGILLSLPPPPTTVIIGACHHAWLLFFIVLFFGNFLHVFNEIRWDLPTICLSTLHPSLYPTNTFPSQLQIFQICFLTLFFLKTSY